MRRRQPRTVQLSDEQVLLQRAKRCARRGNDRKSMLALREACFAAREDPRLWALYAAQCLRTRNREEGLRALRQSLWLRERKHDERRARVLRIFIAQVESGSTDRLRAA